MKGRGGGVGTGGRSRGGGDVWALVGMMVVDYTAADDVLLGPH